MLQTNFFVTFSTCLAQIRFSSIQTPRNLVCSALFNQGKAIYWQFRSPFSVVILCLDPIIIHFGFSLLYDCNEKTQTHNAYHTSGVIFLGVYNCIQSVEQSESFIKLLTRKRSAFTKYNAAGIIDHVSIIHCTPTISRIYGVISYCACVIFLFSNRWNSCACVIDRWCSCRAFVSGPDDNGSWT